MKIVLLRHGKPKIDPNGLVGPAEFGRWVSYYDEAGIDLHPMPSASAMKMASECDFTVCSHLPRSTESARLLNITTPGLVSPLFRECEMPYSRWQYPKLPIRAWPLLFRLLQLAGYSANAETYREMVQRSRDCAQQLVGYAQDHGSVLFVGHGVLNWLLHKRLLEMGWTGPRKSPKKHWGFGEYVYTDR